MISEELKKRIYKAVIDWRDMHLWQSASTDTDELAHLRNIIEDLIDHECLERPRFEDGEIVKFGEKFINEFGKCELSGILYKDDGVMLLDEYGVEYRAIKIKHPTPTLKKPAWATIYPEIYQDERTGIYEAWCKEFTQGNKINEVSVSVLSKNKEEAIKQVFCDCCGKELFPENKGSLSIPYVELCVHHSDWGNDSIDSFKYYQACSPWCAYELACEWLKADKPDDWTIEINKSYMRIGKHFEEYI